MSRNQKIGIVGVPSDLGANMRGSCMGPAAIRISGLKEKIEKLGYSCTDYGDVEVPIRDSLSVASAKNRFLEPLTEISQQIQKKAYDLLHQNNLPIFIGGDHSLAIGSIAGVSQFFHERQEDLGVIWIDAHADLNTPASSPSGNIHGMPLSLAIGEGHECLMAIGGHQVKVKPQNIALIGIRTIDGQEKERLRDSGIRYYTMRSLDERGMFPVMQEALSHVGRHTTHIHLSFDIDAIDPRYAPGVSTAVSGGLSLREAHLALEMLYESGKISSMDFAELNPYCDVGSKSADLTVDLIQSALGKSII